MKTSKKNNRVTGVELDYMMVIQTNFENPQITKTLPVIDLAFIQGNSPYENAPSPADSERWHPSVQMQQVTINTICATGPGSPKQPPLNSIEAKIEYDFTFKWGGNPPPMSTITDPKEQPEIHLPSNLQQTNSLQNPANDPASYLYNFDERRSILTNKAIKRLQKDYKTEKTSFTDGSLFQAPIPSNTRNIIGKLLGRRRRDREPTPQAPATATQAQAPQTKNTPTNGNNTKIVIKSSYNTAYLFPPAAKNRRLNPWEEEQDKQEARIWDRAKNILFLTPLFITI